LKPFNDVSCPRIGGLYQVTSLSGFFYCLDVIVTHTLVESLHGLLGRKHHTLLHPSAKRDQTLFRYW